uniref:Uncharacterized protein n=1 Tax=Arundo donax TaxID=35708 RepID=A0A0A8YIE2_ARUDO
MDNCSAPPQISDLNYPFLPFFPLHIPSLDGIN